MRYNKYNFFKNKLIQNYIKYSYKLESKVNKYGEILKYIKYNKNEGNYSYIYTDSDGLTMESEESFEDKKDLYDFLKKRFNIKKFNVNLYINLNNIFFKNNYIEKFFSEDSEYNILYETFKNKNYIKKLYKNLKNLYNEKE